MTLKLVVKSEASWGREELLLSGNSHGVGRLHDNDLSIQVDCVSGYHAELKRTTDGGYAIIDLKSTNGTFLNGNRVTSPERVKPGDHLKFGSVLVAVEEKIEVVAWPEKKSGEGPSKVVSLKDLFGFESGDHFNTYPITPIGPAQVQAPAPVMANGGGVPLQPVKMAPPAPTPAMAAQQLERAEQLERAREAERLRQLEAAKEAERVRQIEQAREAERVRQIEQAREAERLRQLEAAKEAERARQIEQAREAERARRIEQAREAERARQLEEAKERLRQIEQAKEAERARQFEPAGVAEPAVVNLQQRPEPPGGMDFGSAIHSLTTRLESAMQEISRLKASMPGESPGAVGMNGHVVRPAHPGQAVVQGRDEQPTRREGNEGRASVHTPPPLQIWNPENERAFEDSGKLPTHSVVRPPERLGAARSIWRKICRR